MKVAVVGTCASGKTSLVAALRARGYEGFAVAQEHSIIEDLWRHQLPDRVVYLDNTLGTVRSRRGNPDWPAWIYALQQQRLHAARAAADAVIATDGLTLDEVVTRALAALGDQAR